MRRSSQAATTARGGRAVGTRDRQRVRAGVGMIRTHDQPCGRLLPDVLWQRIQPLLPAPPPRPRGGVPRRVPDRNCVAALVFMARTSTPWSLVPAKELGCGSATTCWRRFDEWAKAGCSSSSRRCCWISWAWPAASTWERVGVDSFSVRAVKGGI